MTVLDYDKISEQDLEVFGPHLWPNHNAMNTATRFFTARPDLAYLQAARAAVASGASTVKVKVNLSTNLGAHSVNRTEGSLVHNVKYTKNATEDVTMAMENLYRLLERVMPRYPNPKCRCTVQFIVQGMATYSVSGRWT